MEPDACAQEEEEMYQQGAEGELPEGYLLGLKGLQDAVLREALEMMEEEQGPLLHPTFKVRHIVFPLTAGRLQARYRQMVCRRSISRERGARENGRWRIRVLCCALTSRCGV